MDSLWIRFALSMSLIACGDDSNTVADPDAPPNPIDDAPVDGSTVVPPVDLFSFEGGEVRVEYMIFPAGAPQANRARVTSFFFDGPQGAGFHPLPNVPGCTDFTLADGAAVRWPFYPRAADVNQLDVGQVILAGHEGTTQLNIPRITPVRGACSVTTATQCFSIADCPATETCIGATGTKDNLGRLYKEPWGFAGESPSPMNTNNQADTFLTPDTRYDIILTGSPEWPAQILKEALYMPQAWNLDSPALNVNPVLQADQALTVTYTTMPEVNKPADYPVNTLVHFLVGANTPIISCIEEGTDGSITISADLINKIRALAPTGGKFIRQHATHVVKELTDGVTHNNKRIDVVGIWCYNYTFTIAP